MLLRTRVLYSPQQYTTEDPLPSSYGRPSTALTLVLRLLVVSINLSMNCKSNQVVRTANNGYSNRLITLQGCTSSHTLPPLIAIYSTCTRQPSSGSPARVSATTWLTTQVSRPGLSPIWVPSVGTPTWPFIDTFTKRIPHFLLFIGMIISLWSITQMNQTRHNSKHSRQHKQIAWWITHHMAQSTPTHASGFQLFTVAMTGHARE